MVVENVARAISRNIEHVDIGYYVVLLPTKTLEEKRESLRGLD